MSTDLIKKVQAGYQVDGLYLLSSTCHGRGPGTKKIQPKNCCPTYSTVKRINQTVAYFAKVAGPGRGNNYEWGYRVKKGPVEVDVLVYDTQDSDQFSSVAIYPPMLAEWQFRGWQVLSQFKRPRCQIGNRTPKEPAPRSVG